MQNALSCRHHLLLVRLLIATVICTIVGESRLQERMVLDARSYRSEMHQEGTKPTTIGERCTKEDIIVYQGPTTPLPNGIPTYTVEIMNVCGKGCAISDVHLTCGWFSSARMINPRIFKRLAYNDCLVNEGHSLPSGRTLSFQKGGCAFLVLAQAIVLYMTAAAD